MTGSVVAQSLTDIVRGLMVLGAVFGVGMLAAEAWIRSRPMVARWRDRRHVARCWRTIRSAR